MHSSHSKSAQGLIPVSPWVGVVLLPVFQHGLHALDKLLEVLLHLPLVLILLLGDEGLVLDEGILTELAELLEAHLQLLVEVGLL